MERNKEISIGVQSEVLHKNLPIEFGTEISLPDYRSEISRLLWIRPAVLPPAHFVGGGNADFSGRVCYHVLYADPDGELHTVETEDSYGFSLPFTSERAPLFSVHVTPDAVIGRVVAPRKLTVRCRADAEVRGYAETDLSADLSAEMLEDACVLTGREESGRLLCTVGETVELEEELADSQAEEVLHTRAEVMLSDVTAGEGLVRCRGDVTVTLFCRVAEEKTPLVLTHRLPLATEIPLVGVDSSCRARAFAVVSQIRTAVSDGRIALAVSVLPSVEAVKKEQINYVRDLFLPGRRSACQLGSKKLWKSGFCGNRHVSVSQTVPFSELRLGQGDVIVDAYAEAELKEGKGIGGELCCHVLYRRDDEYGVCEGSIPFRIALEDAEGVPMAVASVPSLRLHAEGDMLRVDAEVLVSVRTVNLCEIESVECVNIGEDACKERFDVELCYPSGGDTLWDVAKRYAVSPERLAAVNGIVGENAHEGMPAAKGARCLVIPSADLA